MLSLPNSKVQANCAEENSHLHTTHLLHKYRNKQEVEHNSNKFDWFDFLFISIFALQKSIVLFDVFVRLLRSLFTAKFH